MTDGGQQAGRSKSGNATAQRSRAANLEGHLGQMVRTAQGAAAVIGLLLLIASGIAFLLVLRQEVINLKSQQEIFDKQLRDELPKITMRSMLVDEEIKGIQASIIGTFDAIESLKERNLETGESLDIFCTKIRDIVDDMDRISRDFFEIEKSYSDVIAKYQVESTSVEREIFDASFSGGLSEKLHDLLALFGEIDKNYREDADAIAICEPRFLRMHITSRQIDSKLTQSR